jgi:hypothetical protein
MNFTKDLAFTGSQLKYTARRFKYNMLYPQTAIVAYINLISDNDYKSSEDRNVIHVERVIQKHGRVSSMHLADFVAPTTSISNSAGGVRPFDGPSRIAYT